MPHKFHQKNFIFGDVRNNMDQHQKFPLPNLGIVVKGFHGTKKGYAVKSQESNKFHRSNEANDWLGHGIYFWENDPSRAIEWATNK